jgi:hypothetical protein
VIGPGRGDPLPPGLVALVLRVVEPLGVEAGAFQRQAAAAKIVNYSPTMVDVEVPVGVPRTTLRDGPVPGRAMVYDDLERLSGEILVWVRGGVLLGLEQAWYTDDPPKAWPSPGRLRFVS